MSFKHGHGRRKAQSGEYQSWMAMLARCTNEKHVAWARYGGAGVKVCSRWRLFVNFLADVGPRPDPGHSLDRYPNRDGDYEPGNVRWATRGEQQRNRSATVFLEHDGRRLCIRDWAVRLGLSERTIAKRVRAGRGVEEALSKVDFRKRTVAA